MSSQLSPRELEVLQMMADGLSIKESSVRTGLSHFTINDYRKVIFIKLEANSASMAVAQGFRKGLLK